MIESVDDLKSSRSIKGTHGPDFELLDARIASKSSKIPASKERSVWRNKKPKKRTVSFEEDRLLTTSTNTSTSLGPMILSRIMPIYLQSLFEMTIFSSSIRDGMKFYCRLARSHLMMSWRVCTHDEYVSLINSTPCLTCTTWRFIRRCRSLTIRGCKLWWRGS